MNGPERLERVRLHDDPDLFREAVRFTAAETGFITRLIEKDYFCTVLIQQLASSESALVFRGGTCLAKVHAGFYRLSEDLDYLISTPIAATRAERSRRAGALKRVIAAIGNQATCFRIINPLCGANNSIQYNAVIGYTSLLSRDEETIKIEIGLREPLLKPKIDGVARTLLLDPISAGSMVSAVRVPAISRIEAMAEKFRAALSRREVAIRDFYDIDYAARRLGFDPLDAELIELVKKKLAVPGNEPVDVSATRQAALRVQLEARLKPVLRATDFTAFDLERAFAIVARVAGRINSSP